MYVYIQLGNQRGVSPRRWYIGQKVYFKNNPTKQQQLMEYKSLGVAGRILKKQRGQTQGHAVELAVKFGQMEICLPYLPLGYNILFPALFLQFGILLSSGAISFQKIFPMFFCISSRFYFLCKVTHIINLC